MNGRNIRLYPSEELRSQALNTVAIETPRGWRIAKEKASAKIDAVVALSMAAIAALDGRPGTRELDMWGGGIGPPRSVDEVQRDADERDRVAREESEKMILDEIRREGWYQPGGRP